MREPLLALPLCRYCKRPWRPRPGVNASESYCHVCSPERQAHARKQFAKDGKIGVIRGKFMLRVLPSAVQDGDIVRDIREEDT